MFNPSSFKDPSRIRRAGNNPVPCLERNFRAGPDINHPASPFCPGQIRLQAETPDGRIRQKQPPGPAYGQGDRALPPTQLGRTSSVYILIALIL